jgi:hypothetical protein
LLAAASSLHLVSSLSSFRSISFSHTQTHARFVNELQKKPEFYDDDIPLLLLGGAAPTQYLDPDDETLVGLYGLLQACGTPASDDSHGLKRSARPAMELTKSLILDWKDGSGSSSKDGGPQNVIATAFLSLAVKHYAHMQLHVHCQGKDARAGAKEEACQLLVLLLSHHLTEDGEKAAPAMVDDVLHNPKAQQEFERTCCRVARETKRLLSMGRKIIYIRHNTHTHSYATTTNIPRQSGFPDTRRPPNAKR